MSSPKKIELRDFPKDKGLVLFDGVCNLCNNSVQKVLRNDKKGHFFFASLSWPIADQVRRGFPNTSDVDSIMLFQNERLYNRSSAALRIAAKMDGLWPLLMVFLIIPKSVRDVVYDYIAKNRYKWYGKQDSCMMPSPETAGRFVE